MKNSVRVPPVLNERAFLVLPDLKRSAIRLSHWMCVPEFVAQVLEIFSSPTMTGFNCFRPWYIIHPSSTRKETFRIQIYDAVKIYLPTYNRIKISSALPQGFDILLMMYLFSNRLLFSAKGPFAVNKKSHDMTWKARTHDETKQEELLKIRDKKHGRSFR